MQGGPGRRRSRKGLALLAAMTVAPALPAAAQQRDAPNPLLTFSFSSSLNVSDNYDLSVEKPGTSTFLNNTLGLTYQTETEVQFLRFGLSGVARLADLPNTGGDASFDDKTADFDYRRSGADSELRFFGRYNRVEMAFYDPLSDLLPIDPIDGEDLINDNSGYRETLNLGVSFATGQSGPLSFSLSANTRQRNFIDTNDTSLYDSQTDSISASVGALVTPSTRLSLSTAFSHYTAEDDEDTDRENRSASLGLSHEMARGLIISGSLGYQVIDTDETDLFGNRGTTTNDGATGTFGLSQELPDGAMGLSLAHSVSVNGGRTDVQLFRDITLPDGNLSLAAGVSRGESGRNSVIGDIDYRYNLPNGNITLGLGRSVQTSSDDEDLEVTRGRFGWSHDLTAVSGIGLNVDYASTNAIGGGTDRERGRFRASYRHDLTQDWELSGGYQYAISRREGQGDADENSVFMTLGRIFQMRP